MDVLRLELAGDGADGASLHALDVLRNRLIPQTLDKMWTRVTLKLVDGTERVTRCDRFPGCPERPMSRDQRHAKVIDCLATGGLSADEAKKKDAEFKKLVEKWGPRHGYDPRGKQ